MRIVYLVPGEMLRLSGGLGPLQSSAVVGSLWWELTKAGSSTTVEVSYVVGGFMESGFERIAPAVSGVNGEQLRRLKLFVETGKPPGRDRAAIEVAARNGPMRACSV